MKITIAATLFALASLPLLAQQAPMANPANGASVQQNNSQQESPAASQETSASPATASAPVDLRPVSGQLVSKLDSKTAKTGDDIVVETKASIKTADGTEIPKGSKLEGHVLAVHPSGGQNSQVVLQFDLAELKDGKKLPIHTEIQSISPATGSAVASGADATPSPSADNASGPATAAAPGGAMASSGARGTGAAGAVPEAGAAAKAAPAAGTIVSRNGKIAIRTTSVPGVLLANNAPGEQDPRMAQAAGILVGAQRDIQLDGGTQIVIGVASATAKTQ